MPAAPSDSLELRIVRIAPSKKRTRVSLNTQPKKAVRTFSKKASEVKTAGNGRGSEARKATSRRRWGRRAEAALLRRLERTRWASSRRTNSPNFRPRIGAQLQSRMKLVLGVAQESPIHVTFPCFNCDSRLSTLSSHFIQLQQPDSVGAPLHND